MRMGVLVGLGSALALVAVSATDASAGCRRARVCGGYAPAPVYQYAPPPPPAYYAPPAGYYAPPPTYGYERPAYGYVPAGGYYGYRNCDRAYGYGNGYGYGYGSGYGNGYGYGSGYGNGYGPPAAYDGYRPAAVWAPVR